ELLTVRDRTHVETKELAWKYVLPLLIPYVAAATLTFWAQAAWEERRAKNTLPARSASDGPDAGPSLALRAGNDPPVNYLKALVPAVPLALLFLTGPPLNLVDVPAGWLAQKPELFGSRLIGAAMLVGVFVAAAVAPGKAKDCARQFF